jgi:ribosomal protein S17
MGGEHRGVVVNYTAEFVDKLVDRYVKKMKQRGVQPIGFRTATLAALGNVTVVKLSSRLQVHRQAQRAGDTRWILACREYGQKARWEILAGPTADTKTRGRARVKAARWSAHDLLQRLVSDWRHEVQAAVKATGTQADTTVDLVFDNFVRTVEAAERLAAVALDNIAV